MIIYNVTCHLEKPIENEWLEWMKKEHLPEVMATGKFLKCRLFKLLTHEVDDEGVNYAIQYECGSMQHYDEYILKEAPRLREKTVRKFGNNVLAYRSLLEEIDL